MDKIFWVDGDILKSYKELLSDLNALTIKCSQIYEKNSYQIILKIIHSLVYDYPIVLYDSDFSNSELSKLGYDSSNSDNCVTEKHKSTSSLKAFLELTSNLKNWEITLFTSGTTDVPKKITHTFNSITKATKISNYHQDDVWGFAYNLTHMAGIQVFFQALLNMNTIINVFNKPIDMVQSLIRDYQISHISATPTFYRLFIQKGITFKSVKQISCGGEKFGKDLKIRLEESFPSAKIRNIYASTEAGSLFASEGENFKIPQRLTKHIKVIDNELVIHKNILGSSETISLINDWYYSGDIIEVMQEEPEIIFKFIHRKNEMINVGGYKVNPNEVEEEILKIGNVNSIRVYGRKNSVLGNILCADIVCNDITEKEIRKILITKLQPFKIPRLFNFVNAIDITRTGKVKR